MRASQRVKPYGTSSDGNSVVARPFAGTATVWVPSALPPASKVTVFVAAGALNPATTACTRVFFGSQTWPGTFTLSTVQFGTGSLTTGCRIKETCARRANSLNLAGLSHPSTHLT